MTEEEKSAHIRQRLSAFLAETALDGQELDLSVDPILRAEVMDYWSLWFVAERSAGLLRRALSMSLLALVLSGLTSIQLAEELASSTSSSLSAGGKGGKGGKSGGPDGEGGKGSKSGGPDSEGGKGSKSGGPDSEGGKGGKSSLEGGGAPEPKSGKARRNGQDDGATGGGNGGAL